MGGLFGVASRQDCVRDLFYGTDYHFHLGTRRGGMAVKNSHEIKRSIHSIENDYFRSKFEPDLDYEVDRFLGPGEAVFISADGWEQRNSPGERMQICSFLWVY